MTGSTHRPRSRFTRSVLIRAAGATFSSARLRTRGRHRARGRVGPGSAPGRRRAPSRIARHRWRRPSRGGRSPVAASRRRTAGTRESVIPTRRLGPGSIVGQPPAESSARYRASSCAQPQVLGVPRRERGDCAGQRVGRDEGLDELGRALGRSEGGMLQEESTRSGIGLAVAQGVGEPNQRLGGEEVDLGAERRGGGSRGGYGASRSSGPSR